jgi:hypothetical protein
MTKTWAAPCPRSPRLAVGGWAAGLLGCWPKVWPVPAAMGTGRSDLSYHGGLMSLIDSVGPRSSDDPRRRRHREARHRRRAGHRRRDIRVGHVRWRRHGEQCLRGLAHHAPR